MGFSDGCVLVVVWVAVQCGLTHSGGDLDVSTVTGHCVKSGLSVDGVEVYTPQDCSSTECSTMGEVEGLHCIIENYGDFRPDACEDVKRLLLEREWEEQEQLLSQQSQCPPLLTAITLYNYRCQQLDVSEKSLNISIQLPLCDADSARFSQGVKVDFSASWKKSPRNYFTDHPVCRVFNYTGSDFSWRTMSSDPIEVWNHCLAIGVSDKYPQTYYYISLTDFPSGVNVNYTLVYSDVNTDSMQLFAGAWLSRRHAHLVFLPIRGIQRYLIEARCHDTPWTFSQEVSSNVLEITNIPNASNVVTVTVTPSDREACSKLGFHCSPITLTLIDKNILNFSMYPTFTPPQGAGLDWRHALIIGAGVLLCAAFITGTVVVWKKYLSSQNSAARAGGSVEGRQVLWVVDTSTQQTARLERHLQETGYCLTLALQETGHPVIVMGHHHHIIIIMLPSSPQYPQWMAYIRELYGNRPLWGRVRVLVFAGDGQVHLSPSSVLRRTFNEMLHGGEFLRELDERTLHMPRDQRRLLQWLRESMVEQLSSVRYRPGGQPQSASMSVFSAETASFVSGPASADHGDSLSWSPADEEDRRLRRIRLGLLGGRMQEYSPLQQAVPEIPECTEPSSDDGTDIELVTSESQDGEELEEQTELKTGEVGDGADRTDPDGDSGSDSSASDPWLPQVFPTEESLESDPRIPEVASSNHEDESALRSRQASGVPARPSYIDADRHSVEVSYSSDGLSHPRREDKERWRKNPVRQSQEGSVGTALQPLLAEPRHDAQESDRVPGIPNPHSTQENETDLRQGDLDSLTGSSNLNIPCLSDLLPPLQGAASAQTISSGSIGEAGFCSNRIIRFSETDLRGVSDADRNSLFDAKLSQLSDADFDGLSDVSMEAQRGSQPASAMNSATVRQAVDTQSDLSGPSLHAIPQSPSHHHIPESQSPSHHHIPESHMSQAPRPQHIPQSHMSQASRPQHIPQSHMNQASRPQHIPQSHMSQASRPQHIPQSHMSQASRPQHIPQSHMSQASRPQHIPQSHTFQARDREDRGVEVTDALHQLQGQHRPWTQQAQKMDWSGLDSADNGYAATHLSQPGDETGASSSGDLRSGMGALYNGLPPEHGVCAPYNGYPGNEVSAPYNGNLQNGVSALHNGDLQNEVGFPYNGDLQNRDGPPHSEDPQGRVSAQHDGEHEGNKFSVPYKREYKENGFGAGAEDKHFVPQGPPRHPRLACTSDNPVSTGLSKTSAQGEGGPWLAEDSQFSRRLLSEAWDQGYAGDVRARGSEGRADLQVSPHYHGEGRGPDRTFVPDFERFPPLPDPRHQVQPAQSPATHTQVCRGPPTSGRGAGVGAGRARLPIEADEEPGDARPWPAGEGQQESGGLPPVRYWQSRSPCYPPEDRQPVSASNGRLPVGDMGLSPAGRGATGDTGPVPPSNIEPVPPVSIEPPPLVNVGPPHPGDIGPLPAGNIGPVNVGPPPPGDIGPLPAGNIGPPPAGNMGPPPADNIVPQATREGQGGRNGPPSGHNAAAGRRVPVQQEWIPGDTRNDSGCFSFQSQ